MWIQDDAARSVRQRATLSLSLSLDLSVSPPYSLSLSLCPSLLKTKQYQGIRTREHTLLKFSAAQVLVLKKIITNFE
jgi:hypothetical protein